MIKIDSKCLPHFLAINLWLLVLVKSIVIAQHYTDKVRLPMAAKIKFMNHVNDEYQDELALFVEALPNAIS